MPIEVEIDGTVHEFPDDFTDADIAAALSGGAPEETPESRRQAALADRAPTVENTRNWGMATAPFMLAGPAASVAGKIAPRVVGAAAKVMDNPLGGMAVGALTGGMTGGAQGALYGGMTGLMGGNRVARGLRQLTKGKTAPSPQAAALPAQGKPSAPRPTQADLSKEIQSRDIDWRSTDALPITPPRKGIIRGEESQPQLITEAMNLGKKLEKKATPEDMKALMENLRALRQRQHITEYVKK